MSAAFSMQATIVQSTINSQCGQLQSACSRAIRSKFQARFGSVFDMVSLSMRYETVMTVQSCLLGCKKAEMELMRSTTVSMHVKSLHSWRDDLLQLLQV